MEVTSFGLSLDQSRGRHGTQHRHCPLQDQQRAALQAALRPDRLPHSEPGVSRRVTACRPRDSWPPSSERTATRWCARTRISKPRASWPRPWAAAPSWRSIRPLRSPGWLRPKGACSWQSLVASPAKLETLRRAQRFNRSAGRDVINLTQMQPSADLLPDRLVRRCIDHVMQTQGSRALGYATPEGLRRCASSSSPISRGKAFPRTPTTFSSPPEASRGSIWSRARSSHPATRFSSTRRPTRARSTCSLSPALVLFPFPPTPRARRWRRSSACRASGPRGST